MGFNGLQGLVEMQKPPTYNMESYYRILGPSDFTKSELGGESNQEIVSCRAVRACGRARGLVAQWNWISKVLATIFPFSFGGAELSLLPFWGDEFSFFPSHHPPNLLSNFSWAYRIYAWTFWK